MARVAREEVFSPDEIAIVHVMNRVVRRCFLLGTDPLTGQNYDHRKVWIEDLFQHFAGCFGIDLLCFAILSNHFHLAAMTRHPTSPGSLGDLSHDLKHPKRAKWGTFGDTAPSGNIRGHSTFWGIVLWGRVRGHRTFRLSRFRRAFSGIDKPWNNCTFVTFC